jgi:hypothetical protein
MNLILDEWNNGGRYDFESGDDSFRVRGIQGRRYQ